MDKEVMRNLVQRAVAKAKGGDAYLWKHYNSESGLRAIDMLADTFPVDAKGRHWLEGVPYRTEITEIKNEATKLPEKWVVLRRLQVERVEGLREGPCGNLYVEEDGFCPVCGKNHRRKNGPITPGGEQPRQQKRTLAEYKAWQLSQLKAHNIPLMGEGQTDKTEDKRFYPDEDQD